MKNIIQDNCSAILVSGLSSSDLYNYLWKIEKNFPGRLGLRFCRGQKMRLLQGLYDEFSAAFQFPYYFGENWAAMDECLTDLSWFYADAYFLCVTSADDVLAQEVDGTFSEFLRVLVRTTKDWAGGNPNLAVMGRSPTVFQTLLQVAPGSELAMQKRLQELGGEVGVL